MNKTIYRLECANNFMGPYQSGRIGIKDWSTRGHGDKDTPHPGMDKKLLAYGEPLGWFDAKVDIRHFCFAFISFTSLYKWFTDKEIAKLKEKGFVIAAYTVPRESLIYGTHQVIFTRDKVLSRKVVDSLPPRKTPHPKENYDSSIVVPWSEEKSRKILDMMFDRSLADVS